MKKFLSLILVFALLLTLNSGAISALAEGTLSVTKNGDMGCVVTYVVEETYSLVIPASSSPTATGSNQAVYNVTGSANLGPNRELRVVIEKSEDELFMTSPSGKTVNYKIESSCVYAVQDAVSVGYITGNGSFNTNLTFTVTTSGVIEPGTYSQPLTFELRFSNTSNNNDG